MNSKKRQNKSIRSIIVGIVRTVGKIEITKLVPLVLVSFPDATQEQICGNISTCCMIDKTVTYNSGFLS